MFQSFPESFRGALPAEQYSLPLCNRLYQFFTNCVLLLVPIVPDQARCSHQKPHSHKCYRITFLGSILWDNVKELIK